MGPICATTPPNRAPETLTKTEHGRQDDEENTDTDAQGTHLLRSGPARRRHSSRAHDSCVGLSSIRVMAYTEICDHDIPARWIRWVSLLDRLGAGRARSLMQAQSKGVASSSYGARYLVVSSRYARISPGPRNPVGPTALGKRQQMETGR